MSLGWLGYAGATQGRRLPSADSSESASITSALASPRCRTSPRNRLRPSSQRALGEASDVLADPAWNSLPGRARRKGVRVEHLFHRGHQARAVRCWGEQDTSRESTRILLSPIEDRVVHWTSAFGCRAEYYKTLPVF